MVETIHALQVIGASEFETLITCYLRRRDRQLAGLIATGINEQGRAIPCKVDGIVFVPSNPPCCIAVASTTTKRRELSRKWLGGANRKGDIEKAAEEFQRWKADDPHIKCVLYLATNRPLGSDTNLYRLAIERGRAIGIEVQIIEASLLVDFLDRDPEGQYLREELLGIEAERLSDSLLRKIAYESLIHHQREFSVGQGNNAREIKRDVHIQVMERLEKSYTSLICLRGASGMGKSTLLRQVGKEINAKGGIALWVPAEEIVPSVSLATILLKVLRRFHPSLNSRAGNDALRLANQIPGGLVLLIDDVNRLPYPSHTLHSIEALVGDGEETFGSAGDKPSLRFVVPLWPSQLAVTLEQPVKKSTRWEFVELRSYSPRERADLVRQLWISHSGELRQVIDALDGDPFLCGLVSVDVASLAVTNRSALMRRIFEDTLRGAATEVASKRCVTATPNEFILAIDDLIELMLRIGDPEPLWEQVRVDLGHRTADLLHELAEGNRLGWIDENDGREFWRWKHRRLRDALVGRWLAKNVLPQVVSGAISDEVQAWLTDPGLAEAWALAVAFLPTLDLQIDALGLLAEHQPLALAEALRLGLFPLESEPRRIIAEGLWQALTGFNERAREFVSSPQRAILAKLAETNDLLVLEVTEGLPQAWYIWAARLRNGDVAAGLEWLRSELAGGDFLPYIRFPLLEEAIEAFATFYEGKRDYVASELAQVARQLELSAAAMTLAGYLAWPELARTVWQLWNALSDSEKLEALVPAVWGLSRCGDESVQGELEAVLLWARELSEEERVEGHHASERFLGFMNPLWLARRWPITSAAAKTWAKVARDHPDLRKTMCYVLRGIDHPATIEAYVRWSAEKGGTFWDEAFEPLDPLAGSEHAPKIPTSAATRDHLWKMVQNESDQTIRKIAFRFWKRWATIADLGRLQSIPPTDPMFDEVLKVRLKLRDSTAAELLIERMYSEPGKWCGYAPILYGQPGVIEAFLDNLEAALDDPLGRSDYFAQHLPPAGVTELVKRKRDLLLKSPRTWLALWRSDVPEALALVQEAVAEAHPDDLQSFFFQDGFPFPASQRMLDALVPVLDRFPASERERLAELAVRAGFARWVREHLTDVVLAGKSKHFWITSEDVVATLTAAAEAVPKGVRAVIKTPGFFRLEDRSSSVMDMMEVVRKWLGSSPNGNQLTIAAMLIATSGTSRDISWWQDVEPEDEPAHTAWRKALYILRRRRWQS